MSQRIQAFLLRNTKGLQHLVNDRLGARPGAIGRFFTWIKIGPRNMGQHAVYRWFRVTNYLYVVVMRFVSSIMPSLSRFTGHQNGPLNYFGIINAFFFFAIISHQTGLQNYRHTIFNSQDKVGYYTQMINMAFPPSFLNNRISAHFIEINQIVLYEMSRKFNDRKAEILKEREVLPEHIKKTKYATNPNYVYPRKID